MKRNRDAFSEAITGVFMTAVLALLAYFTIVISGIDLFSGRARVPVRASFVDVGGLKTRDNVIYRGMKVGTVEDISLGDTNVTVTMAVDKDVVLRDSAQASVQALSLLGGNYLLLDEGEGKVVPLDSTIVRGKRPADFMRTLGDFAASLEGRDEKGSGGVIAEFRQVGENLNRIAERIERGEGTIGRLLSADDSVYNEIKETVAGAKRVVVNAENTMSNIVVISERLEKGEGTLGRLLSRNDDLYRDIKKTMENAATISERLEKGEGTLGKILSRDETVFTDLKTTLANLKATTEGLRNGDGLIGRLSNDKELADDAARLVANLKTVSDRIEKGDGTLGRMVSDRAMYDELNALIKDVRQIVDNWRDTTPITTFGSLATGAL